MHHTDAPKETTPSPTALTRIAFLGLGAMGSRMATRLSGDGTSLSVWSRTSVAREPGLAPFAAAAPAAAVANANVVFAMLTDDDASRAVWLDEREGALRAMQPGAIAVECSTLGPRWLTELAARARDRGVSFVDAPVVGSRPQAEAGSLVFLAGGEAADVNRLEPILRRMGQAVHHVGPTPAGSYAKLIVNALFATQVAALAELLGFAAKAGCNLATFEGVLGGLAVTSPAAKGALSSMLAQRFEPQFPLELAAKDLRYALAAAQMLDAPLPLTQRTTETFELARTKGLHAQNLTAMAALYRD
jgi:3-hydroxyisobutyrate dehydrogenase